MQSEKKSKIVYIKIRHHEQVLKLIIDCLCYLLCNKKNPGIFKIVINLIFFLMKSLANQHCYVTSKIELEHMK